MSYANDPGVSVRCARRDGRDTAEVNSSADYSTHLPFNEMVTGHTGGVVVAG